MFINTAGAEKRKQTRPKRLNSSARARGSIDDNNLEFSAYENDDVLETSPVEYEQESQVESANIGLLQETINAQQNPLVYGQKNTKSKERLSSELGIRLQKRRDQAKKDHHKYLEEFMPGPSGVPTWINELLSTASGFEVLDSNARYTLSSTSPNQSSSNSTVNEIETDSRSHENNNNNIPDEEEMPRQENAIPVAKPSELSQVNVDDYEFLNIIGEGSYGQVWKCRKKDTDKIFALKEIVFNEPRVCSKNFDREVGIMQLIKHGNIVQILGTAMVQSTIKRYIVMECMDHNVDQLIRRLEREHGYLTADEVNGLMQQLLTALDYLHEKKIIHRDLKPSNLLLTTNNILKLCDFGSAQLEQLISTEFWRGFGTQYYRAPELLLKSQNYDSQIDIWSAGCIFGELLCLKVVFQGKDPKDQVEKIFSKVGTPNIESWPEFEKLKRNLDMNYQLYDGADFKRFFSHPERLFSPQGFKLLVNMLKCNPRDRITAKNALNVDYFTELPASIGPDPLILQSARHKLRLWPSGIQ